MEETAVVTCFLRNGAAVLLFRRSEGVGSYSGRWGAVAGHAEGDPDAAAREEIAEEAGLADAVSLVRRGDPFPVEDRDRGTRWLVHPYLFDCESREVTTNYETAAHEWVHPTEIRRRDTVPDLWASYDAVRPTVETVRADETHGSAYLSLRAVEVLRDEAAIADDWDAVAETARELRAARPSMTAARVRVDRTMARADRTPAAVERAARSVLDDAVDADERAAEAAARRLDGTVATLSRSGTVRTALERAVPDAALLPESRPGREGVAVAESLAEAGLDVTLTSDAALPGLLDGADAALVGADAVRPGGAVVNKVGTYPLALAADRAGIPLFAVCARDKIGSGGGDAGTAPDIYDGEAALTVENPLFERVPPDLVTVVTEDGALDADDVRAVAAEHRALADWDTDRDAQ
ncbi:MAG: NUDIX domain-containing protein [Halobacteriaceae archaeon]